MCEGSGRMQPKETISKTAFPAKIFTFRLLCLLLVSVSSLYGRLYKYKLNSVMLIRFSCETVIRFLKLVSGFICLFSARSVSARTEADVNYCPLLAPIMINLEPSAFLYKRWLDDLWYPQLCICHQIYNSSFFLNHTWPFLYFFIQYCKFYQRSYLQTSLVQRFWCLWVICFN